MTTVRGKPKLTSDIEAVTGHIKVKPGDIVILANGDKYMVMGNTPEYAFIDISPEPGTPDKAHVRSFFTTGEHCNSALPNIVKIIRKRE
jgi:hypothetical protein